MRRRAKRHHIISSRHFGNRFIAKTQYNSISLAQFAGNSSQELFSFRLDERTEREHENIRKYLYLPSACCRYYLACLSAIFVSLLFLVLCYLSLWAMSSISWRFVIFSRGFPFALPLSCSTLSIFCHWSKNTGRTPEEWTTEIRPTSSLFGVTVEPTVKRSPEWEALPASKWVLNSRF